jgi:hypothetical protein
LHRLNTFLNLHEKLTSYFTFKVETLILVNFLTNNF